MEIAILDQRVFRIVAVRIDQHFRGCIGVDADGRFQRNAENLTRIAAAKSCNIDDLTVVLLDRPRHDEAIAEIRKAGARIHLISDGDVAPAFAAAVEGSGVDMMMGIGGAPEGVLAAAALKCMGGDMQARLIFMTQEEKDRAPGMGISDLDKVYSCEELAAGDVFFAATGVTNGDLLNGVRYYSGGAETHTIVMRSKSRTVRFIQTRHQFEHKPLY